MKKWGEETDMKKWWHHRYHQKKNPGGWRDGKI